VHVPKGGDSRTAGLPAWIDVRNDGVVLALHVQPGARRTAIAGLHGDRLKVAIATPPIEGRANAALLAFLAKRLGLPKSTLSILTGASARDKRVALPASVEAAAAVAALSPENGQ
jgi:hypothetical protein